MREFINNWSTTLSADLLIDATSCEVPEIEADKLVGAGHYLLTLDDGATVEIIKATSITAGTITIERGQEGTAAADWPTGTVIEARVTAGDMVAFRDAAPTASGITASIDTIDLTVGRATNSIFDAVTGEYAANFGPAGLGLDTSVAGPSSGRLDVGDICLIKNGAGAGLTLQQMAGDEGRYDLVSGVLQETGTTSTGESIVSIIPDYPVRPVISAVASIGRVRVRSRLFSFLASDGTNRYTSTPIAISEVTAASPVPLLKVSWVDNVNSGKIVITYRNNSGTISTVNTASTPSYTLVRGLTVDIAWTGSTWEVKVYYGSVASPGLIATITDFCFISNITTARLGFESIVKKSAGTTSRFLTTHGMALEIRKR